MKPKYWAIIILAAVAISASIIYYAILPQDLGGPIFPHRKIKSQASSAQQSAIDIKDWETYKDKERGFELQFPNGFLQLAAVVLEKKGDLWLKAVQLSSFLRLMAKPHLSRYLKRPDILGVRFLSC